MLHSARQAARTVPSNPNPTGAPWVQSTILFRVRATFALPVRDPGLAMRVRTAVPNRDAIQSNEVPDRGHEPNPILHESSLATPKGTRDGPRPGSPLVVSAASTRIQNSCRRTLPMHPPPLRTKPGYPAAWLGTGYRVSPNRETLPLESGPSEGRGSSSS